MNIKCVFGLALALISFAAIGKDDPNKEPAVKVTTDPAEFKTITANLQKQMEPGGRYQFVRAEEHRRVDADLDKIQGLLEKQASGTALEGAELVAQLTAQSEVNAILTQRDGDRLICEHVAPVGSHLPKTICFTYAERQARHNEDMDFMYRTQNNVK